MRRRLNLARLEDRLAPAIATWDGGGANNNWTTAANWVGDVAPQPGDDVEFPDRGALFTDVTAVNNFADFSAFNSLSITGGNYQISGNSITFTAGVSFNFNNVNNASTLALAIAGAGGMTVTGGGRLVLSGDNSFTGQTTVSMFSSLVVNIRTALGAAGAGNDTVLSDGQLFIENGTMDFSESFLLTPGSRMFVTDSTVALRGGLTLIGTASGNQTSIVVSGSSVLYITSGIGEVGGAHNMFLGGDSRSTVIFTWSAVNTLTGNLALGGSSVIFDGNATSGTISANNAKIGGSGTIGPLTFVGPVGVLSDLGVGGSGGPETINVSNLNIPLSNGVNQNLVQFNVDVTADAASRINATGSVQLGGGLNVTPVPGTTLTLGRRYRIIDNDGGDGVVGTFARLPEGAAVRRFGDKTLRITYRGGTGNDVELIVDNARMVFAAGADAGGQPLVQIYGPNSALLQTILAYDSQFTGGVRVATADITGDGIEDLITSPGAGGGPHIKVFDGVTFQVVLEFLAYAPEFTGGVFVAAGDVNGDGRADIVTGAGFGGGPHVQAFSGVDHSFLASFMAYDLAFTGGVTVASRSRRIITGAGPGGGPHVKEFSGNGVLENEFFAFDASFRGGVFVATVAGYPYVLVSPGAGGGPHVRGVIADISFLSDTQFLAYDPTFTGGVRVAGADVDGDGFDEIITSPGPGGGPHVKVWKLTNSGDLVSITLMDSFFAFDAAFTGGVFVG